MRRALVPSNPPRTTVAMRWSGRGLPPRRRTVAVGTSQPVEKGLARSCDGRDPWRRLTARRRARLPLVLVQLRLDGNDLRRGDVGGEERAAEPAELGPDPVGVGRLDEGDDRGAAGGHLVLHRLRERAEGLLALLV